MKLTKITNIEYIGSDKFKAKLKCGHSVIVTWPIGEGIPKIAYCPECKVE